MAGEIQRGLVAAQGATTPGFTNVTASGLTTLVAAVAGKKIAVFGYRIDTNTITNVTFQSSGGAALTSTKPLQIGGSARPWRPQAYFETLVGEGLQINLTIAATLGVDFDYLTY